jgi:hypothetical protein
VAAKQEEPREAFLIFSRIDTATRQLASKLTKQTDQAAMQSTRWEKND